MDISDGLAGDLAKLCRVSGVAAEIAIDNVPMSPAAKAVLTGEPTVFEAVLTGGDDYEILCTVPPAKVASLRAAAAAAKIEITEIGSICEGAGAHFRDAAGNELKFAKPAYSHF